MYVRDHAIIMTLSSLGASSAYTTGPVNGLLYGVRVRAGFAGAAGQSLKLFREQSSGSTELSLFRLVNPSSVWHEYYPRNDVMNSSAGSSGLDALWPIDDTRIYATFASSSALASKVLNVICSVI